MNRYPSHACQKIELLSAVAEEESSFGSPKSLVP
jgi:hypothetical protein